jgi:hypothetical protein
MDQEIACPELLCRAKRWGHVPVDLAQCSSLAVHGLRACNNDLVGELAVANDLKHLYGGEAIHKYILSHLRHVPARGRFVKDDIDICQGGQHRFVILDVTLPEFRFWLIQAGFPFL